jgi:hypothetical protein
MWSLFIGTCSIFFLLTVLIIFNEKAPHYFGTNLLVKTLVSLVFFINFSLIKNATTMFFGIKIPVLQQSMRQWFPIIGYIVSRAKQRYV